MEAHLREGRKKQSEARDKRSCNLEFKAIPRQKNRKNTGANSPVVSLVWESEAKDTGEKEVFDREQ
ncbi:MAG TPA: hypothetical protein DEF48_00960 [Nostoc sp. UBA8866]|nr:hypothetical protein [Nostoc sp. UBA8866]